MGCASAAHVQRRSELVPRVEHHQHIFGPMLVDPPQVSLPTLELPAELERVLRERERVSGKPALGGLYTEDAQVLDVSEGEDHWVRGQKAIQYAVGGYSPDIRFLPNAYALDASTGYIAGVLRSGDSTEDAMHFVLGVKKDAGGAWRIALEAVTNKPPRAFAQPITAADIIRHLDDAGIERAVVHSTAFWLGSIFRNPPVENEAARVREANDWTVEQVGRYPERLIAFCGVNPLKDYALEELRRCAKLPQVRGMKLHFGNSGVDVKKAEHVEKLRRFFRAANDNRMALMLHLWTMDKSYGREHSELFLNQVLPEAPDITVQIAHMAGAGRYVHDDALEVFANAITAGDPRMKNVYFDLATVVDESISDETLALLTQRLRQIGLQRILFGADTPILRRPPPVLAWATFRRRVPLTDEELRVIANNVAPYLR